MQSYYKIHKYFKTNCATLKYDNRFIENKKEALLFFLAIHTYTQCYTCSNEMAHL